MDNKLWMNYDSKQNDPELSAYFPLWPYEFEMMEDDFFGTPLMQGGFYSNPFYQTQHPFQEFETLCDDKNWRWDEIIMEARMLNEENEKIAQYNIKGESTVINKQNLNGLWDEIIVDASMLKEENEKITQYNIKEENMVINRQNHNRVREERVLTLKEVSQYFYMPIIQAAKELNVGLTLLKKKCRDLGIPRWPHRKMKSMQKLINNVQELGGKEGTAGDMMRSAIVKLEKEQKLMEMKPSEQMKEDTRRLRQACFKANYKKRKLVALLGNERLADC
ncbi:hypothetical protein LUZ63_001139 [Rhynchospora breviuscula]|uniref:RWP-RK domain-containing protein n=1 Tax=Rhynchospora breviuscula TaxID=2022672 RepID=A0A9Q0CWT8_9POAL|nr:hypothetical protein LUZ63_001139 [Rhynchospora breviuscula]